MKTLDDLRLEAAQVDLPRVPSTAELCRLISAAAPTVIDAFRRIEDAKKAFARVPPLEELASVRKSPLF